MMPLIRRQRGFTLVSAIFILVVLAALAAAITVVSTTQQIGSADDVQGAQAFQAARAGIEWGIYQVQSTPAYNFGHTSTNGNLRVCPPNPSSFVAPAPRLSGFTITVRCVAYSDGATGGPTVYQIQSTACNRPSGGNCPGTSGGANYIERRLQVTL